MNLRDAATAVGGLVALGASAAAGMTIWVLLTAPTTVAGMVSGADAAPLRLMARVLLDALSQLVRYL